MSSLQLIRLASPRSSICSASEHTEIEVSSRPETAARAPGIVPSLPSEIEHFQDARRLISHRSGPDSYHCAPSPLPALTSPAATVPTQPGLALTQPVSAVSHYELEKNYLWLAKETESVGQENREVAERNGYRDGHDATRIVDKSIGFARLGTPQINHRAAIDNTVQRMDRLHPLVSPAIKLAAIPATLSLGEAAITKTVQLISNTLSPDESCQMSMAPFVASALLPWVGGLSLMIAQRLWHRERGPLSQNIAKNAMEVTTTTHLSSCYFLFLRIAGSSSSSQCSENTLGIASVAASAFVIWANLWVIGLPDDGSWYSSSSNSHALDEGLLEEGGISDVSTESLPGETTATKPEQDMS